MQYTPPTIDTSANSGDLDVARKHQLGGEKKLFVAAVQCRKMGELELVGDGSGIFTPDPVFTPPTAGADLQVKVKRQLLSGSAAVMTVIGVGDNNQPLTGTATFAPPSWVINKTFNFGESMAVDVVPAQAGRLFKSITSVSITNAKKGSFLQIFTMPVATDWQYVEKVESVNPNIGTSPGVSIPDRLEGTSEVVRGRSNEKTVSVQALHRSVADGLQRFAGQSCCLRVDVEKAGRLVTERTILANCILQCNPDFPDGSETSKQAAEGMFEEAFMFPAP
jgi:hypothetical protein